MFNKVIRKLSSFLVILIPLGVVAVFASLFLAQSGVSYYLLAQTNESMYITKPSSGQMIESGFEFEMRLDHSVRGDLAIYKFILEEVDPMDGIVIGPEYSFGGNQTLNTVRRIIDFNNLKSGTYIVTGRMEYMGQTYNTLPVQFNLLGGTLATLPTLTVTTPTVNQTISTRSFGFHMEISDYFGLPITPYFILETSSGGGC